MMNTLVEEDAELAAMLELCKVSEPLEECVAALTASYASDPPELNPYHSCPPGCPSSTATASAVAPAAPAAASCTADAAPAASSTATTATLLALGSTRLPHSRRAACYCCCEEVKLLFELFFPRQFGLPIMALPQGRPLLQHKLLKLKLAVGHGVGAYPEDAAAVCTAGNRLLCALASIRESLKTDLAAAFVGDPACRSYSEVIRCYPGFAAMLTHRVAHVLYGAGAALYARELAELAHSATGVDIHPGASIGDYCFIDHATGTVIGETAVLGAWCRLYQSVTIGALHFAHDPTTGALQKNYKRHPTIGSNVVIGSGAKLLGPITIGNDVSIGANCWIQEDVPSNVTVVIKDHPQQILKHRSTTTRPNVAAISRSAPLTPPLTDTSAPSTPPPPSLSSPPSTHQQPQQQ